jgi:hypothetical protein
MSAITKNQLATDAQRETQDCIRRNSLAVSASWPLANGVARLNAADLVGVLSFVSFDLVGVLSFLATTIPIRSGRP